MAGSEASSTETGAESSGSPGDNICYGFSLLGFAHQVYVDATATGIPTCTTRPDPCGGDVSGVWNAEAACGYEMIPNLFENLCPGATQQITGSSISGTQEFNENGTYAFDVTTRLEADVQLDSVACAELECEAFGRVVSQTPNLALELVCLSAGPSGCDCAYTLELSNAQTGTWESFADEVTLSSDDGVTQGVRLNYCVLEGRLSVWTPLLDETPLPDTSCMEDEECEGSAAGSYDGFACDEPDR